MTTSCTAEGTAARAFQSPEEGEKYLDRILTTCKDTAAGITRMLIVLALCMAAFELLIRSGVSTVTITFLQLNDSTPVTTFLPVVVAVLQYQITRQMLRWRLLERTFTDVLRVVHPTMAESGLGVHLVPTIPLFATEHHPGSYLSRMFLLQHRFEAVVALFCAFVILPLFQAYAFIKLFTHAPDGPTPSLWIALSLSTIMTLAYFTTIMMSTRDGGCAEQAPGLAT
jgi:hypothetical protein